MTLIAVTQGLVLADSCRGTPHGYEFSPGKINVYAKPFQMRSARLRFKDWFYGYAGTGDEEVIKHAGEMALIGALDLWWDRYKHIDEMRMIGFHNGFTILLFGLNGVASLEVESGHVHMAYIRYDEIGQVSVGSGAQAYSRLLKEANFHICPVRAMYGTFTMEPTCGGQVEVWRLPTASRGKGTGLVKLGVLPQKDLFGCFKMMATPQRFHFKKESEEWLRSVILRLVKSSPNILSQLTASPSLAPWELHQLKSTRPRTATTSRRSKKSTPSPPTSS